MHALPAELIGLEYRWTSFQVPYIWPDGRTSVESSLRRVPTTLETHPDDLDFVHACLRWVPAEWRKPLTRSYTRIAKRSGGRAEANRWLGDLAEQARQSRLCLASDEDAIRGKAKSLARGLWRSGADACRTMLEDFHIKEPKVSGEEGLVARCRDERWWRRQLRKMVNRTAENVGRQIGLVHKRAQLYVTDSALRRRRQQQIRNQAILSSMVAVSEEGQEFDLDELIEASIANPANRRAELMVRARGFEVVADDLGHVGDFWTITAPSRFHAVHSRSGQRNEAFDGSTVREAHDHIKTVWARIRAAFQRQGISPYGFRVVEPHHDGTPHWHLLVFLPPEQLETARRIVRHYALEDSPDEPGANRHRCTFKRIDKSRGSATGYIAKYIAKNIDGFALRSDDPKAPDEVLGKQPETVAERVVTWASVHGIRQFQQVGGPPVGVWREARRLKGEHSGLIEQVRKAADEGDWWAFVRAMGGPIGKRSEWPVRVARLEWWMTDTGELDTNRYQEPAALRPFGLEYDGVTIPTRGVWEVVPKRDLGVGSLGAAATAGNPRPWSSVNNCTATPPSGGPFKLSGEVTFAKGLVVSQNRG
ncbi:MAG: replication endonuclease [Ectothiorhodospiraceae bacterium]|nr:replication endonuclease [Ectothiorhodospiraceae bacterium]